MPSIILKLLALSEPGRFTDNNRSSIVMKYTTGTAIRILRNASGMSQAELAKASGVSTPMLCLIEKGGRESSLELLKKIASVLNIPFSAFALLLEDSENLQSSETRATSIADTIKQLAQAESKLRNLLEEK